MVPQLLVARTSIPGDPLKEVGIQHPTRPVQFLLVKLALGVGVGVGAGAGAGVVTIVTTFPGVTHDKTLT